MHVNWVSHLLHNYYMRVRAHFKNIDEIIATIKAATIKKKDRKKDFRAGLPTSPDPVITRRATWLRDVLYYKENSSFSYHCQQLDKCRPRSQQSKKRYQCGRFDVGLGENKSMSYSSSQRRVLRRKCLQDNRSIQTAEEYAIR